MKESRLKEKSERRKVQGTRNKQKSTLMDFCDLMCIYAEIPKDTAVDGSGSCRTFVALYCHMKKNLVHKNMPCRYKVMKGLNGTIKGKLHEKNQ